MADKNTVNTENTEENISLDDLNAEVEKLKTEEAQQSATDCSAQIEQLKAEKKELEEKFLMANADMQNIRRRSEEASIKARREGAIDVLKPFLTAIDNFHRAFNNTPEDLKDNAFIQGIQGIEKNFSETLQILGVEFFGEAGEDFDENKHDSMMIAPDAESGKVGQVFEKGVMFRGSILRHAKVSVGN